MMLRKKVTYRWVLLVCLLGLLLPLTTLAQEPVDLEEVEALEMNRGDLSALPPIIEESYSPFVEAYAETYDLSLAEAQRRLDLQDLMIELANAVSDQEDRFAGSWLEHGDDDIRLFVAFAAPEGEALLSKYLVDIEWADLVEELNQAAEETGIPYESGISFNPSEVQVYTPQPEELERRLSHQRAVRENSDVLAFVKQDKLTENDSVPQYPYLFAGTSLSTCTAGYAFRRNSDQRVFMSTAGHCGNTQYTNHGNIYLGPIVFENYPSSGRPQPYGGSMDFQLHDIRVRSLDATNVGFVMPNVIGHVVGWEYKSVTLNNYTCKNGKTTGMTCGTATNINYRPNITNGTHGFNYVKVEGQADMSCPGDSGSPVGRERNGGGVIALGILLGGQSGACGSGTKKFFVYTPLDELHRTGYTVVAMENPQYFHQHVFWSETNCVEQKVPIDGNGNLQWSNMQTRPCPTSLPGSGTLTSYTTLVVGDYLHEAAWRGGKGYIRTVPLNGNGSVNWGSANGWSQCCTQNPAIAQGSYIIGNYYYQHVFTSTSSCYQQKVPIDTNGNLLWGSVSITNCPTSIPHIIGTLESYDTYVVGGYLWEAVYRGGKGYIRKIPVDNSLNDVDWSKASSWSHCCTRTGPRAQGAYVVAHPHNTW